jgi:ABC-type branched-subunit amino acid transport system ATPase component
VPSVRVRLAAFTAAAALGGLAGGLSVQLVGVADPTRYGPILSFELLVAVLLGGVASAFGAPVGMLVVGLVSLFAAELWPDELAAGQLDEISEALLLLIVLSLGTGGLADWASRRLRRRRPGTLPQPGVRKATGQVGLSVRGLAKRFGEVDALAGVDLEVAPGTACVLLGPNGSGKSTVLRVVTGALDPDAGSVQLGDRELSGLSTSERVRLGVVRTLQTTAIFPGLTAFEHALVGAARQWDDGGAGRALARTPRFRRSAGAARSAAARALADVGLDRAHVPVQELSGFEQRLVILAAALATGPTVLLLDEPAAGAGPQEVERLGTILRGIRDRGVGLLLVEHNLRLARDVGDVAVVLAAGRVVATGAPEDLTTTFAY